MSNNGESITVAIVGGTGKEGRGLAYRWLRAGYAVIIGSRTVERAGVAADELRGLVHGTPDVRGTTNVEAAQASHVTVMTVPYGAHEEILKSLKPVMQGRLLIDATVPLQPGKVTRMKMPRAGSAAQEAHEILGAATEVAAAFHTISHEHLMKDEPIECDVLVTGTSAVARQETLRLVEAAGLQGWDAGPLENSAVSEGLTSVLIHINKKYGSRQAGIRITGTSAD